MSLQKQSRYAVSRGLITMTGVACLLSATLCAQTRPFTLQQVLSAPYATDLAAAPAGEMFAWVEHSGGRNNLYVGGAHTPARALTHNADDNALDVYDLAWAPDGQSLAYTFGPSDDDPTPDGKPPNPAHLQRTVTVDVMVQSVAAGSTAVDLGEGHQALFARDGHTVFFVRGGQIWSACVEACGSDAAAAKVVAHPLVYDRGSASALTLSPDGKTLAYISRRRELNQPAHSFLALYDLSAHTLSFPAPSTGDDAAPSFSPDGAKIAWLRTPFTRAARTDPDRVSALPWSIQQLDLATGSVRALFTATPNQTGSVLPHLATGSPHVFYATAHRLVFFDEATGWVHLYALDPTATASTPMLLTPGSYEVEDAEMTPDHAAILYASNDTEAAGTKASDAEDADRRHLWRLDLHAAEPKPERITAGSGIETRPKLSLGGALAALVADAHVPMHPALVGTSGALTALNPGTLPADYPAAELVTPKQALFPALDGVTLHGQLFLPKEFDPGKEHAALIFVHGGPRRQMLLGYPAMDYYSNAYAMNEYLTSLGFVVLSVNYRCGVGYGLDFRQCLHGGPAGGQEYDDVLSAMQYLRAQKGVDAKRIGIWGGSYGGYLTGMALARNSDIFAAGVDFHGVHDWNLEDNAGDWVQGSYAQKDAAAAIALAASPLADISRWRSPVLFIHGDDDGNVAYAQTPVLTDRLRARNSLLPPAEQVAVQELIFPDEVHGFLLHSSWLRAYTAEAAFFQRTLKP